MRLLALSFVLVLVAQTVVACPIEVTATLRPSGGAYEVRWTEEPGAIRYLVYELREHSDDYRLIRTIAADGEPPRFVAHPTSTATATYRYLIIAEGTNGAACLATTKFEMPGDEKLAAASHKRIVPFAGSVRGANGSDFRTALTLRHFPLAKGRIVFRPVGKVASDTDPSIPYQFGDNGPDANDLHWDDVMAAMGVSGTGTIEIIPEARQDGFLVVPDINAHIYNVTPQGTFGSRVPAVAPSEWLRNELQHLESLSIPPVHGNYRRNAGFRTLTEVLYNITVTEPGQSGKTTELRKAPANYTLFGSLEDLFGGPVSPAAEVTIRFIGGDAIAFHTYTENATNDPTLVVRDPQESGDVTWGF